MNLEDKERGLLPRADCSLTGHGAKTRVSWGLVWIQKKRADLDLLKSDVPSKHGGHCDSNKENDGLLEAQELTWRRGLDS